MRTLRSLSDPKLWTAGLAAAALAIPVLLLSPGAPPAIAGDDPGQQMFTDQKCNLCHAVPSVGIEATTKSDKMKGPEIAGLERDADWIVAYLKKEADIDGKKHMKPAKGSDDELKTLATWLLAQ